MSRVEARPRGVTRGLLPALTSSALAACLGSYFKATARSGVPLAALPVALVAGSLWIAYADGTGRTGVLVVVAGALLMGALYAASDTQTSEASTCGQAFHTTFGELSRGGERTDLEIVHHQALCREPGRQSLVIAGVLLAVGLAAGVGAVFSARSRGTEA